MTRFLPISIALAEAAVRHGRRPTADQFAEIEAAFRKRIVIDFETSAARVFYNDGYVVEPADFIANQLAYPGVEIRLTPGAAPGF